MSHALLESPDFSFMASAWVRALLQARYRPKAAFPSCESMSVRVERLNVSDRSGSKRDLKMHDTVVERGFRQGDGPKDMALAVGPELYESLKCFC